MLGIGINERKREEQEMHAKYASKNREKEMLGAGDMQGRDAGW